MYQYSMTQWVMGNEDLEQSFQRLKKCGYDAIEFAADPYTLDAKRCLDLMHRYDMDALSMCGMFGSPDRDLTTENGDSAVRYLHDSVDLAHQLGVGIIIVVPSRVGCTEPPVGVGFERLWENAVNNLRKAADYAHSQGVRFVIEAINRYETYFVNTLTKAWELVQAINHPAVGIMADTFHMSLEENNFSVSLHKIAPKLWHVHLADNTREPAGMGRTNFQELLFILREIGYQGSLAMEFMPRLANPYGSQTLQTSSALMDAYAMQAIRYMRTVEKAVELATR